MTIEKTKNDAQLTLKIIGRLDTSTAPQLETVLMEETDGVTDLIFDCAEMEYISSAGLRVFLKAQKKMNIAGSMKVIHVNEANMEVFSITGFDQILTIE